MLQYFITGLVLGGIYAICSAGLIMTYVSTGVMNFAFGAIAFFVARLYYFLHVQQGWSIWSAAIMSIVVFAPAFMGFLYLVLLRYLPQRSQFVRVAAMIGVAVALPAAVPLVFGPEFVQAAPGLSPNPSKVYHVFGATLTADQLISYVCIILILAVGYLVMKRTSVGLTVRAVVDSPAMASLSGSNPSRVALGVWMANGFLAGLAGVLAAPILSVTSVDNYAMLMVASFAAVVAARLKNLAVGVIAGLSMGVATALAQSLLPPMSSWTPGVITSIPFLFIVGSLVFYAMRGGISDQAAKVGGALDAALRTSSSTKEAGSGSRQTSEAGEPTTKSRTLEALRRAIAVSLASPGVTLALLLPLLLTGYQVGLVAEAAAFAMIFLSYTLLTGHGGVISLCQITFAGIGALGAATLVAEWGWSLPAAIVTSGLAAAAMGTLIGALTLRMGELYVALTTLAFGLLMYELVFSRERFENQGIGVAIDRPEFAFEDSVFSYLALGVFLVFAFVVVIVRRSTIGLALAAARSSGDGARALGVGIVSIRLFTFGMSAFIASVGGSFLAIHAGAALPMSYQALAGLVWFAVLVSFGARTVNAAMFAGLIFVFAANLMLLHLPLSWAPVPILGFGIGAALVAKDPEGSIAMLNGAFRSVLRFFADLVRPRQVVAQTALSQTRG